MKKTKKATLNVPLSKNFISVFKKYQLEMKKKDFIFWSTHYHYNRKPLSTYQYFRIVKNWLRDLGVEDVSDYSTHSIRKTKSSVIYDRTKNVDAVRRLLGQSSVTNTSAYLGISDESALDLARTINIWWWQFRTRKNLTFPSLDFSAWSLEDPTSVILMGNWNWWVERSFPNSPNEVRWWEMEDLEKDN